jgi:hypothetical protein
LNETKGREQSRPFAFHASFVSASRSRGKLRSKPKEQRVRVTPTVTLFATDRWLAAAFPPLGECHPVARLERGSPDGARRAAIVSLRAAHGRAGSALLIAEDGVERMLALFDQPVALLIWRGPDLLLGFAGAREVGSFAICPGIRLHPAAPPADEDAALAWLRLSTRRSAR